MKNFGILSRMDEKLEQGSKIQRKPNNFNDMIISPFFFILYPSLLLLLLFFSVVVVYYNNIII